MPRKYSNSEKKVIRNEREKAVQAALVDQENALRDNYIEHGKRLALASVMPASVEAPHSGLFVHNWRDGWRWFSNLALTAIVAVNAVPIPPEVINALPPHTQASVTIGLAVVGVLGRFINQARNKALPPITNEVADGN